jgi:radical SAM superfamily enzyme YgiQ (UPF0313 family)
MNNKIKHLPNGDFEVVYDSTGEASTPELAKELERRRNITRGAEHHSDKGYSLSTHEKQAEFARKRNLEWDEWKANKDIL